jgi:hypothetical protein
MKKLILLILLVLLTCCNDLGQANNWEYFYDCGVNNDSNNNTDTYYVDTDDNSGIDSDSAIDLDTESWIDELSKKCDGVVCDNPPADSCFDNYRIKTYRDAEGWCMAGRCIYGPWYIEPCTRCYYDDLGAICEI